mmetsp:Transcript_42129/g.134699  ORF Transcript_42129/g.134699 Transcript_42129/m.134699 type:complete len:476 (-) Transcript_42129:1566-2993(-)
MYSTPPEAEVALEEFERFAMDRLRVLKEIDTAKSRGKKDEEMQALVKELVGKHLKEASKAESQRKDQISHFVLRLAYCRSEELRRWFLAQEGTLFRYRFREETTSDQVAFMHESGLPYSPITDQEHEDLRERLATVVQATVFGSEGKAAAVKVKNGGGKFYKVPFEEVPELVSSRRVLVKRGAAYVPADQLAAIVVGQFRAQLSKSLVVTARKWASQGAPEEHDRLAPIVEALSQRYLGPEYGAAAAEGREDRVSMQDVPALARRNFPLCMQNLYNRLHSERHLKHAGRMQLGLFLKGVGLPMEEALAFWKQEFSPKCAPDKFEKNYAYNIRHNYGREGKRQDYTPYSCLKVVSSMPGAGEHHGCPYRTFGAEQLKDVLKGMKLKDAVVSDVMDKVANQHYQLACGSVFEGAHGCACDSGINHPNEYFDKSREADAAAATPHTPAGQMLLAAGGSGIRAAGAATPLSVPPMARLA